MSSIKFKFTKLWSNKNIIDSENISNEIHSLCIKQPDYIYVGTTDGLVLLFQHEEQLTSQAKVKHRLKFKRKLRIGDKTIEQLNVVSGSEVNYLIVLHNGELTLHDLFTLEKKITLPFKGITTFTCNNGNPYYGLCVHIRKKLFVYNFEQGFDAFKEYHLPDTAEKLCWCKNFICVGFKTEYSLLNVMDGTVTEVLEWDKGHPAIKLLPTDDIVLKTKTKGVFANLRGKQQAITIPLSQNTLQFALSFPFLIALNPDSIEVSNLVVAKYHVIKNRPNETQPLKCIIETGRHVFVADTNALYALTPSRTNYQCFSIDMMQQVREFPTDKNLFKKYMGLLLGDTNNPFGMLVSKYALSFERVYGGPKFSHSSLPRAKNHAMVCVKRLYRVITSYFYEFTISVYRDNLYASVEDTFLSKIYLEMMRFIRAKNSSKDPKWNAKLTKVHNTTLEKMGVPVKYWLTWESVKSEHEKDVKKMLARQMQTDDESSDAVKTRTEAELFDIDVFTKLFRKKGDVSVVSLQNNHLYVEYTQKDKKINVSIDDQFFFNKASLSVMWARVEHHFYKLIFKSYNNYKEFKRQLNAHVSSIRSSLPDTPKNTTETKSDISPFSTPPQENKREKEASLGPAENGLETQKTKDSSSGQRVSDEEKAKKDARQREWRRSSPSKKSLLDGVQQPVRRARSCSMGLARMSTEPMAQRPMSKSLQTSGASAIPINQNFSPKSSGSPNTLSPDFGKSPMVDPLLGMVVGYLEDSIAEAGSKQKQYARSHADTTGFGKLEKKVAQRQKRRRAHSFHAARDLYQNKENGLSPQIGMKTLLFGRREFGEEVKDINALEVGSDSTNAEEPLIEVIGSTTALPFAKELSEQNGDHEKVDEKEDTKQDPIPDEKEEKMPNEQTNAAENAAPEPNTRTRDNKPKVLTHETKISPHAGNTTGPTESDVWSAKSFSYKRSKSVQVLSMRKQQTWERLKTELAGKEPYGPAIAAMKSLPLLTSPGAKLACCLESLERTLTCVSQFWHKQGKDIVLGADDIVPIFAWVILKTGLPNIYSELNYIEELSQKNTMKGKFGYCFATMQIAVEVVMGVETAPKKRKNSRHKKKSKSPRK